MLTMKKTMGLLLAPLVLAGLIFGIKFMTVDKAHHKVDAIAAILLEYALTHDIDRRSIDGAVVENKHCELEGFDAIRTKIATAVASNNSIKFNLVGFPYKSQNIEKKVAVAQLDEAEQHSLEYLNTMLEKIADIYPPGAFLTIFTDGMVFCDLEGVSDEVVIKYEKQLKQLATGMYYIQIKSLADLLPGKSPAQIRSTIESFSPSVAEFEILLATDLKLQEEVSLLEKRMAFEFNHAGSLVQLSQVADITKKLIYRGMQYSAFLSSFRPLEAIRLSVHYQQNVSKKMGIKLSQNSFITPWHGVLAVDSKGIARIEHLQDVVSRRRA